MNNLEHEHPTHATLSVYLMRAQLIASIIAFPAGIVLSMPLVWGVGLFGLIVSAVESQVSDD